MTPDIRRLLDELYAFAPDLREHESELIPIIQSLLTSDPATPPDPAFVERLRRMLRERASSLASPSTSSFSFLSMKPIYAALAGGLVTLLVAVPVAMNLNSAPSTVEEGEALFSYSITPTGPDAFGDLSTVTLQGARSQSGGGGGMGGGGAEVSTVPLDADSKMIAPDTMIYPPMPQTRFVYDGELPVLSAETVDVLERQRGISSMNFSNIADQFNVGILDLGSFGGAQVDSVSAIQKMQYGYMINISLTEGSVSLSQAWEYWPHPESKCTTEDCYRQYRINPSDVPADDVLLSIARDFLEDHGVDLRQYGTPVVDRSWENPMGGSEIYVPEVQRVTFPLLIDGKPVYEEGGMPVGISMGVHVKEKKVTDLWGLMDQRHRASAYPALTDSARIKDFLSKVGNYSPVALREGDAAGTETTVQDIKLGAPTEGFVKIYNYENGTSSELVVPALLFPVKDVPEGVYLYRQTVAVPLAEDLFNQMMERPDYQIMY